MTDTAVGGLESAARPAVPPPGSRPARFPTFDGYRAIAASIVVVTHVTFMARINDIGWFGPYAARLDIGVAVFFLISGFLLYRPFVAAHLSGAPLPNVRRYFRRRFLRIFPAYWLCAAVVFYGFGFHRPETFGDAVIFFGLLQIYSQSHILGGIQQAWSLCTEISFYVFLPFWALLLRGLARRVSRIEAKVLVELAALAVLFAGGVAFKWWVLVSRPEDFGTMGSWLPSYFDHFALGMGLAVLSVRGSLVPRRSARAWLDRRGAAVACWVAALVLFWVVAEHSGLALNPFADPPTRAENLRRHLLYGFASLCFLVPGVFGNQDRGLVRRFLRNPVLQWLGLVSYGIYLWHEAWIDRFFRWTGHEPFTGHGWSLFAFAFAASVAAAAVSYYALERPVLSLKERRPRRRVEPVAVP